MYDWVKDIFDSSPVECERITLEEAEYDLDNFKADGWDLPEEFTATEYRRIWNELVYEQEREANKQ